MRGSYDADFSWRLSLVCVSFAIIALYLNMDQGRDTIGAALAALLLAFCGLLGVKFGR